MQNTLNYYLRIEPFTKSQLKNWGDFFINIYNQLNKRNIFFLVVFTPIKHRIYPEFLSNGLKSLLNKKTRLEQLKNYLIKKSKVKFLDLTKVLLIKKKKIKYQLYFKTDTHWTKISLFYAYKKILNFLSNYFPELKNNNINNYKIITKGTFIKKMSDLSFFIHNVNKTKELKYKIILKKNKSKIKKIINKKTIRKFDNNVFTVHIDKTIINKKRKLKISVIHDSFFYSIHNFLGQEFNSSRYFYRNLIKNIPIFKQGLNIVILEIYERFFIQNKPIKLKFY